jgi:bifunctional DNase/RNase
MRNLKIIYESINENSITTYLYDPQDKILLPIETTVERNNNWEYFVRTLMKISKLKIKQIEIYLFQDNTYYSYVTISSSKGIDYKINLTISNSIGLVLALNVPLLIKTNILYEQGIKISQDIILNSLKV